MGLAGITYKSGKMIYKIYKLHRRARKVVRVVNGTVEMYKESKDKIRNLYNSNLKYNKTDDVKTVPIQNFNNDRQIVYNANDGEVQEKESKNLKKRTLELLSWLI